MMKIAICDDEPQEIARAEKLLAQYAGEHPQYELKTSTFSTPLELLTVISEKGGLDVLLLDIYMAGMLGTEVAQELRNLGDNAEIIFLTTSKEHALTAFEVDAVKYLVKPYSPQDFFAALDKVMHRITVNKNKAFTLKTSAGITKLSAREVIFTETSKNNYQTIHRAKGEPLLTRMTSLELFELLSQDKSFVKCGVSFNVNLKYVRQISKEAILFDSGEHLLIPHRIYAKLKEDFLCYQLGDTD
ncbi:LytTR family DNA-binding domain-containing protein [Oscillospiraceae bacterium PP1C4]